MNKDVPPNPEDNTTHSSEHDGAPYASAPTIGHAPDVTLAGLLAVLRRRAVPMAIAFAIVLVVGIVYTLSLTPRYTATSAVLFDNQNQNTLDLNQMLGEQAGPPISIENQIQILTSSSFAGKVVDKLKLESDPEFGDAMFGGGFGLMTSIKRLFGNSAPPDESSLKEKQRIATINRFLDHMTADVAPGTSVISIQFSSQDPSKAAQIANAVADGYITDQLEAKFESTRIANAWLSQRLAELRKRVAEDESAVASYAAANNLQVLNEAGQTINDQRVGQLNDELLKARADLAEKETRYEGVRAVLARGGSVDAIPDLMSSGVFQSLRQQRAALIQQQSQLSSTFGARHPEMIKLNEQIASVNQQISGEVQRVLSALQSEVAVARSQVGVIQGGLNNAQGTNATASQASVRLRELQRTAESSKSLYEAFLKRFNELGEQGTLQSTNARVIGRAIIPASSSYPKTSLYLAGTVAAALLAAVILAFVLEQFDRGLRTRQQVEAELGLPMLANLPLEEPDELKWDEGTHDASEVVVRKPLSAYNEAFRLLRAGVQLSNVDAPPVLILITSALPNEGKSTGALSMARSAALAGDRVLLIDGDIRRPAIGKILGIEKKDGPGLVQCITGEAQVEKAIIKDALTPLSILLPGTTVRNPPDLIASAAMRNLLASLKKSYDLVIIDSSPVLPVIDSRLFGRMVDTTVFFVRWEDTPKDAANEALRLLHDFNVPVAGVALTMTDRKRQSRYGYYGDSYSYYGRYRDYYAS